MLLREKERVCDIVSVSVIVGERERERKKEYVRQLVLLQESERERVCGRVSVDARKRERE